jgi:UDP-3-O-[3-hydroxymyristoyl] glucosamine N-acyltransferase
MYELKKNKITVKEITSFLKSDYIGENFVITSASSLNNIKNNSILFYSEQSNPKFKLKDTVKYDLKKLENYKNIVLITTDEFRKKINIPTISSKNPRLDFSRVIMKFFAKEEFKSGIHKTVIIDKKSIIGNNVYIGPYCSIGKNVKIGNNVKIFNNTSIFGKTEIGSNSVIMSNTVIGSEGFGFIFNDESLSHFPHLGSVKIGNNVWVGPNCTIEKSTVDQTIIEDHVKIDTLVNIGHNTIIGESSCITAGNIICGKAKIGKRCYVAPNSVIDVNCDIGDDCIIGTSSLVRSNFPKNSVIIGSPAKLLRKNV